MRELISAGAIAMRVRELGHEISRDYRDSPGLVLVGVLRGSFCFLADLARAIDLPVRIDVMALRSYAGETGGAVEMLAGPFDPVEGADVLLVEDIIERGATTARAAGMLMAGGARSVEVCTLLWKPSGGGTPGRYTGFEVPDAFVVGYGLDLDQQYRNLPFVAVLDEAGGAPGA
ncbi:MAG: hypoxanthine phosphoribosyltransferase [Dehalococcoidia bacterium]|nr:hypoxanthine phosphoribosyltransferase [Dehalococcoidia bacterium]